MNLSVISEGGAMRGAYAAGVLKALYEHYGLKRIDFAGGSSAGVIDLAFYITGNLDGMERVWNDIVTTKEFLSFSPKRIAAGKPIMNLDYLMESCARNGLSDEAIRNSNAELIIPVTKVNTGKAEIYSSKEYKGNLTELIAKSIAMPFVSGRNKVNGNVAIDGGMTAPLPIDYKTFEDSAKIVIMTKTPLQAGKPRLGDTILRELGHYSGKMPRGLYSAMKNKEDVYLDSYRKIIENAGPELALIQPEEKMSRFDNSRENIKRAIRQGHEDAVKNESLQYLMDVSRVQRPDLFR